MTTSIKLKKSSISGRVPNPGDLDYGELAINYADGILYFKNSTNVVGSISGNSIGVDSAATIAIIDSAYVQSRQINNPSGVDSSATINLIDSAYIQARQIDTNTQRDSAFIRGVFSAGGDITYNSSTGQFSLDVESVYTADNFDSDYILAKDSANTAVERNKHDATTKNFSVAVASKTADHVYNGTGSGSGYVIDGAQSPIIQLQIGRTYRFTLSSSDMSNHPFRFYYDAGRTTQYTTNVTTTSTYAEIEITEATPTVLHYQCSAHGYMGHAFVIGTRNLTGFNTDNLSEGSSNVYYSNTRVETLVDSSYVQSRQINNPSGVDSSATIDLVDSAYVQARQINNPSGVDSSATINLIDSAYVQARQTPLPPAGVDSAATINLIDSAYVQARQTSGGGGVDSSATINLIDSAYVQARQTSGGGGVDSATTLTLIDSSHVQSKFNTLRESDNTLVLSGSIIPETDSAFSLGTAQKKFKDLHLSGGTVFLDNLALSADPTTQTINIGQIDSIGLINVVGVIATVDSAGVSAIVDSAFLEARLGDFVSETELTSKNFTTFDSADATSVIDSSYINSLNADAGALNGQNGAHYLDYNNFTNTPQGGIDYGTVIQSATSAIDILDILIAQTTVDYGTVGSPGSLKSNYGTL